MLTGTGVTSNFQSKKYFGGGSVNVVLPSSDIMVPRSNSILDSLAHGTCHYHGIASLRYGFEELERVDRMEIFPHIPHVLHWSL